MDKDVEKILAIIIIFIIILVFVVWFLTSSDKEKTTLANTGQDISPACGGWQAIYLCNKACYSDNTCDTTRCNPKNPADTESDTCKVFLEKIKSRAIAEASPQEVSLKDGTATIQITVTDQNKNPIKATATASGAGSGSINEFTGTGSITVKLTSVGAIRIKVTPDAETKLSAASAIVNVVR